MLAEQAKPFFEKWDDSKAAMRKNTPNLQKGFGALFQATMAEGALTVREKELIALSIGLAVRCDPCINLHVEKCLGAGASREEILEAAGVAVMMQGGPSYTYIPKVIAALDYLEESARE